MPPKKGAKNTKKGMKSPEKQIEETVNTENVAQIPQEKPISPQNIPPSQSMQSNPNKAPIVQQEQNKEINQEEKPDFSEEKDANETNKENHEQQSGKTTLKLNQFNNFPVNAKKPASGMSEEEKKRLRDLRFNSSLNSATNTFEVTKVFENLFYLFFHIYLVFRWHSKKKLNCRKELKDLA